MSSCSRRYASNSTRILNQLRIASTTPVALSLAARRPLLFLYPECFKHASTRQYHTGHEPGQGRAGLGHHKRPAAAWHERGPCGERNVRRHLCTSSVSYAEAEGEKSVRRVRASAKETANSAVRDHRGKTILTRHGLITTFQGHSTARKYGAHHRVSFRKTDRDFDRRTTYYLQDVDAERHFTRLKALLSDESEPEPRPDITRYTFTAKKARQLTGAFGPNMWIHHDGSGCAVKIRPDRNHGRFSVELQGTERAREITREYLRRSEPYSTTQEDWQWMEAVTNYSAYDDVRNLPDPPRWTLRNFKHYVDALTSPHEYRSAMRYVYQGTEHRHQVVGDLLERVFNDTSITPFASTMALRTALRFCRQHTDLSKSAHRIWQAAHNFGLQPDISCFNTELSRCLVIKDFDRYTNLLLVMRSRSLRPDSTTFALLLRYAQDPGLRRRILDFIEHHNLVQTQRTNSTITSALLKQEIFHYSRGRDGLALLDERLQKAFGPNWLTTRNVERLLRACRIRRANTAWASDVLAIVQQARNSNISLDSACMTELFRIAKKAGNVKDAIEILKSKPMQKTKSLSQELLESFFLLAWQKNHVNLCRLIWIYAATLGRVSREMQRLVQRSLQTNVRSETSPKKRTWLLLAGKVIINADLESKQASTLFPRLAQREVKSSTVEWLLDWTEDTGIRHEQMQLSQLLLEQDLHAWRFYEPVPHRDFLRLMDDAMALDDEWSKVDTLALDQPAGLLARSLNIPLRRRAEPVVLKSSTNALIAERRQYFAVNEHKLSYDTFTPLAATDKVDGVEVTTDQAHEPINPLSLPANDVPASNLQLNQLAETAKRYAPEYAGTKDNGSQGVVLQFGTGGEPGKLVQQSAFA